MITDSGVAKPAIPGVPDARNPNPNPNPENLSTKGKAKATSKPANENGGDHRLCRGPVSYTHLSGKLTNTIPYDVTTGWNSGSVRLSPDESVIFVTNSLSLIHI